MNSVKICALFVYLLCNQSTSFSQVCTMDSLNHFFPIVDEVEHPYTHEDKPDAFYEQYRDLDTLCFEKILQYLKFNKAKPNKGMAILNILQYRYFKAYCLLDDTLILQVISNDLRYGTSLYAWGGVSVNNGKPELIGVGRFCAGRLGKLILPFGRKAIPYLQDILYDRTPVGTEDRSSETQSQYSIYQLRRKDFAYLYIALLLGEQAYFDRKPKDRDKIIQDFMERHSREIYPK